MNLTKSTFTVGLCFFVILQGTAKTADLTGTQRERIEDVVAGLQQESQVPGLSVAIAVENEVCYSEGFGLADIENQIPVSTATRFRTASVAKPMTAAVILALAEQGSLNLDEDVRTYLPEVPEKRWKVSCRQLLGHLGGIRHYKDNAEAASTKHYQNLRAALGTFQHDPLIHEPGTAYRYSSFGFNLLGSVAEGATGTSFVSLLNQYVLAPAEMSATVVDNQRTIIPHRVRGYIKASRFQLDANGDWVGKGNQGLINAPLHDTSMKIPGGGLLSTAEDLARFSCALNQQRLLTEDSLHAMWTEQRTTGGESTGYGLGWRIRQRGGHKVVYHTGGQAGTSTILVNAPASGIVVAIMCNLQRTSLIEPALNMMDALLPAEPVNVERVVSRLRQAVEWEVQQKSLPAFSIALVDGQETIWSAGFGHQDAAQEQPASADTVYRVGSVSKLFTDLAIMQLVEQGKLDMDAPIQEYLPSFQPRNPWEDAQSNTPHTLRQFMAHQSGLVRESPVGNYFDPTQPTLQETVESLNATTLVYPPNTRLKYSNAAVAVIGSLLEKYSEFSHPEHVRKAILDPLNMTHSGFALSPQMTSHVSTGWMRTYDGRRFEAPTFLLGTGPAGNLYASVNDLAKFVSCLFRDLKVGEGKLLRADTFETMITPVRDPQGREQSFGLGFHVQELDGYKKIGHGGAVYGFSTQLEALPERKLGVVAASALDGSNGVVSRICDYALRLMLAHQDGKPLPEYKTTVPLSQPRARELVGRYKGSSEQKFASVNQLGDEVYLQRGVFRYDLRASEDTGTAIVDDVTGFGTEVKLTSEGKLRLGSEEYTRLAEDMPPAAARERWRGLIGEYGWDHNVLYILEEQGQLYALIEWFYYYPLKEIDRDTFQFPDYGLYHGEQLVFSRDDADQASKVIAASVEFQRRPIGLIDGETFRIEPVVAIDSLRPVAMQASPPVENGDFRESDLVELTALDETIKLDIRYASTNNFTGAVFYNQARAFMQRPAAEAVVRANKRLRAHGLGLLVHDAYRPWFVTKMFWDATPAEFKDFVANPANGSRHNRGCAVDITLYDLASGEPIQMVAGYDEFSQRSFPLYPGGTGLQRWYRDLLRRTMESEGFTVYEYEWWHFDYQEWRSYRIGNAPFEQIQPASSEAALPQ